MFGWIKRQLDYKARYEELLRQKDDAAAAGLQYMAMYEALCASLPHDHDKSTRWRWKEYSNHRLQTENDHLKKKLEAQNERLDKMMAEWTKAHWEYGFKEPPKGGE